MERFHFLVEALNVQMIESTASYPWEVQVYSQLLLGSTGKPQIKNHKLIWWIHFLVEAFNVLVPDDTACYL